MELPLPLSSLITWSEISGALITSEGFSAASLLTKNCSSGSLGTRVNLRAVAEEDRRSQRAARRAIARQEPVKASSYLNLLMADVFSGNDIFGEA